MNIEIEELKKLTSISAISGHEDRLITYVADSLKGSGAQLHIDYLGNVTATFKGKAQNSHSLLFFAHLDELGLIVKSIEESGFLRVERVGGVPEKTLPGTFVDVYTLDEEKSYTGFFGCYSHHITPADKKYTVPAIKEMYVDLGAENRSDVLSMGINIGSMITYSPLFHSTGKNRLTAKSLDNRMGVYILLQMAKLLKKTPPNATIHLCFSVQEEFNIRGCLPVFERLTPDAAVCLDITPAMDTPEYHGGEGVYLGHGPAICYFNFHGRGTLGGLIPHPKLVSFIRSVAEEEGIKCQADVMLGVITDDAFAQLTGREGVAMAHISVPLRYTHSPVETIDLHDLSSTADLCFSITKRFDDKVELSRGIMPNHGK
jgi:putative aminopeptidase FrvX